MQNPFTKKAKKERARRSAIKQDMSAIRKIGKVLDKTPRTKVITNVQNYAKAIGLSVRVLKTKAIG